MFYFDLTLRPVKVKVCRSNDEAKRLNLSFAVRTVMTLKNGHGVIVLELG